MRISKAKIPSVMELAKYYLAAKSHPGYRRCDQGPVKLSISPGQRLSENSFLQWGRGNGQVFASTCLLTDLSRLLTFDPEQDSLMIVNRPYGEECFVSLAILSEDVLQGYLFAVIGPKTSLSSIDSAPWNVSPRLPAEKNNGLWLAPKYKAMAVKGAGWNLIKAFSAYLLVLENNSAAYGDHFYPNPFPVKIIIENKDAKKYYQDVLRLRCWNMSAEISRNKAAEILRRSWWGEKSGLPGWQILPRDIR